MCVYILCKHMCVYIYIHIMTQTVLLSISIVYTYHFYNLVMVPPSAPRPLGRSDPSDPSDQTQAAEAALAASEAVWGYDLEWYTMTHHIRV